jgi:hypothetical protein
MQSLAESKGWDSQAGFFDEKFLQGIQIIYCLAGVALSVMAVDIRNAI